MTRRTLHSDLTIRCLLSKMLTNLMCLVDSKVYLGVDIETCLHDIINYANKDLQEAIPAWHG